MIDSLAERMKNALVMVCLLAVVCVAAFGVGRCTGTERSYHTPLDQAPQELAGTGPRAMVDPGERGGIVQKIALREVKPQAVYEVPREGVGREVDSAPLEGVVEPAPGIPAEDGDGPVNRFQQVTYCDGTLSVFAHDSISVKEYQYRLRGSGCWYAVARDGEPLVREKRLWIGEARLSVDGGVALTAGGTLPYAAADFSAAVLTPRFRTFVRAEVTTADGRVLVGGRITF